MQGGAGYHATMSVVRGMHFYLGKSPAAKNTRPGTNLNLDDDGFLCQSFRKSLLKAREGERRFRSKVDIPELPPLDVEWVGVGETAGIVFWRRNGQVVAAGLLLNGLECNNEMQGMAQIMALQKRPIPPKTWQSIVAHEKPVIAHLFYDLASFTDPVIATAAPALANAFFGLFGTNETEESPG